jgi:hypothetical protein
MANDINPHPLVAKALGAPPAVATSVKASEHNEAHAALSDFPGVRYVRGSACADKASNAVHCEIYLQAVGGDRDIADVGCPVYVYYNGTHIWDTVIQILAGEAFISFADADCDKPSLAPGIANYAAPAFIAGLHIYVDPYPSGIRELIASKILFSNTAPGGVHGGSIPRQIGAPTAGSMEEGLVIQETVFGAEHVIGTGAHAAGAITSAAISTIADLNESDQNLFAERFEEDDDNDGIANGYQAYGAGATYTLDGTHAERGVLSQRCQCPGPGQGISGYPTFPTLLADYCGYPVYTHVRAWTTAVGSVRVAMTDGVATVVSAAYGVAGGWVDIPLPQVRNAAATNFRLDIYSEFATDFWVEGVKVNVGKRAKALSFNPWELTYDLMKVSDDENWVLNGDFRDWTNPIAGALRYPDWWGPGANPPAACNQDAANYRYGIYGYNITLAAGQSVVTSLVIPRMQVGEIGYITGWLWGIAGVDPLQLVTTIGGGGVVLNILPNVGAWKRFILLVSPVAVAASALTLTVLLPAGNNHFVLSGLSFSRGRVPIAFKPSGAAVPYLWDCGKGGALGAAALFMNKHNVSGVDCHPVSRAFLAHKLVVKLGTNPGGAVVDTFTVYRNGAPTGITLTIAAAATAGQFHLPAGVAFAQSDLIQVWYTPGAGSVAANASCVVEGVEIGN